MTIDKSKLHLVPELVKSKVEELLNSRNRKEIRENYAQQIEVIREYCDEALRQYTLLQESKVFQFKRKGRH